CAIWAIPLGPQRHYASTFFVVLSPDWIRSWKGRAMSDKEIAQIPAIPSPTVLADLKMRELPPRISGWKQAREQLRRNKDRAPRNNRKYDYLLKGLLVCRCCQLRMQQPSPTMRYSVSRLSRPPSTRAVSTPIDPWQRS